MNGRLWNQMVQKLKLPKETKIEENSDCEHNLFDIAVIKT